MDEGVGPFTVLQQTEWNGRSYALARHGETGRLVHLLEEPRMARGHPGEAAPLPAFEALPPSGQVRRWMAPVSEGATLADWRQQGRLSGPELAVVLLAVAAALRHLAALYPPVSPAFLDPACIKRAGEGAWVAEYPGWAHAAEARRPGGYPPGLHAFGRLLFWLVTGHHLPAETTRVPAPAGMPTLLEGILQRSLARSYASLGALEGDLERFAAQGGWSPAAGEQAAVPVAGGHAPQAMRRIAINATNVALWGAVGLAGAALVGVLIGGLGKSLTGRSAAPQPLPATLVGQSAGVMLPTLSPPVSPQAPGASAEDDRAELLALKRYRASPAPEPQAAAPAPAPASRRPATPPPVAPAAPPGPIQSRDAEAGGIPTAISLDGRWMGHAWAYRSGVGSFVSLEAFNQMFGRFLQWHDVGDGTFRLWDGTTNIRTRNARVFNGRLWLDLDSALAGQLSLRLAGAQSGQLHFARIR